MKLILSYIACFALGFIALVIYKIQNPTSMNFVKEGGPIENLSALFFFLTFLIALLAVFRNKEKFFPALISLAGLATFGDELEWGRKIFHYKALLYVGRKRIDSLHDFLDPFYKILKQNFTKIEFFIGLGILSLAAIYILLKNKRDAFLNFFFSKKMFFFAVIGILFTFSFLLDHDNIVIPKDFFLNGVVLEECAELAGAVALFFLSLGIFLDEPKKEKPALEK